MFVGGALHQLRSAWSLKSEFWDTFRGPATSSSLSASKSNDLSWQICSPTQTGQAPMTELRPGARAAKILTNSGLRFGFWDLGQLIKSTVIHKPMISGHYEMTVGVFLVPKSNETFSPFDRLFGNAEAWNLMVCLSVHEVRHTSPQKSPHISQFTHLLG